MNDMTNERPFRDAARRAEWDEMTVEEKLDKLAQQHWPDMFQLVPPPPPDPLDNLLESAPRGMSKQDLEARWRALTPGVFDDHEQRSAAYEDYMIDSGRNLPSRYRDPETDRIIDTKSGEDITEAVEFKLEASRLRDRIAQLDRDAKVEEDFGNEKAAAIAREQSEEAAVELAQLYKKHGRKLSVQMQERLADA